MNEEIKCKFYSDNVCRKKYKRDCLTCISNEYDSLYLLNYENQVKAEEKYKRLEQKYNEYKKENEELKFYIDSYRQIWEVEKYRSALEEIREICKLAFAVCDDDCGNANKIADIIDKINKVLESEGE